ncbi:efflux RND transporter periplasmic adaptor subunit [Desulfosediminicola sp.]|uniref:efflux RND transporter periplasmic adaptor subunit n=1 Tax=Desulfosediminicola sp. TaxID=2886825 RepID=UPI003AF2C0EA
MNRPLSLFFFCTITVALFIINSALAKPPVQVIISEVVAKEFGDKIEALGTLRANESVQITAAVTDTITVLHFEDGQRVNKGDVLVEMTSQEEHALLAEEQSRVAEAQKQYDRLSTLVGKGVTSTSELDEQQRELGTAQARLRAIESRLQDRLILAPFSGVVGLRNISVGALIEPGDMITTLDDDSVMKLDFTVPSIYLASLYQGLPIEAKAAAFSDKIFTGKVSSIDSRIDSSTRSISVRALIPNPEELLKPGLLMNVILLKNPRSALVVPEEALVPVGGKNFVYVVDPSQESPRAEHRQIQTGLRRQGEVEVVEGVREGEFVITHGTIKVQPDQPVSVITTEKGSESLEQLLSSGED